MQISKCVLGVGVALAVLAVGVGWVAFPTLLQMKIKSQIRLEEGGDLYQRWIDIPIPIYMKVYFFNVTNPEEVLNGAKPVLVEQGPYVYRQRRQRVVEKIDVEADTIDFRPKITYFFEEGMSVGTEDDIITLVDIPYVSVVSAAMQQSVPVRSIVREYTINHNKSLFMQRSVRQLTFEGYIDGLMKDVGELKGEQLLPNNTFGIYYGKNGTAGDLMKIYSGVTDNTLFGQTISWKENVALHFWGNDVYCNMINGSDGSVFPPFVTRDRVLRIFSSDMCRSIYMTYLEDVVVRGVPGYRFITPREVLEDPRINPENVCFCKQASESESSEEVSLEGCPKAGVFYLAPCRKGAPIVVSWPHFYDGDASYAQQSIGLQPDKDKHETSLVLEPNTGSLIKASKRFQINIELKPTKFFKPMKKVPSMLMPVLWADESVELNDENAEMINKKLMKPVQIVTISTWALLGVGLFIVLLGSLLFFRDSKKSQSYKRRDDWTAESITYNK